MRKVTEEQLSSVGIFYDQLVMGLNRGERVIINDIKPGIDMKVASAYQIPRNEGIGKLEI
jgi:hypothetical protein